VSTNGIGDRLKKFRKSLGLSQAELARRSNVSAAYLSELESGLGKRPGGEILLRLANGLEVTVAELLGQDIRPNDEGTPVPDPSLLEFAKERKLPASDIAMLASIRFRGEPPRSSRRWAMIYDTIVTSRALDEA
jgi:transcriptional regulator with XRE-family HTH domain